MAPTDFSEATNLAKSYILLAQQLSETMISAVQAQQKAQHENMLETARLCRDILNSHPPA